LVRALALSAGPLSRCGFTDAFRCFIGHLLSAGGPRGHV